MTRTLTPTRIIPLPARDRALHEVAAIAGAIVVAAIAALVGALLSWQALATDGTGGGAGGSGAEAAGVVLAPAGHALVVDSLGYGGPAMRAGLRVGDVVEAIGGARPAGLAAADRALGAAAVDIRVRRGDKRVEIHLPPVRSPPLG